MKLSRRRGNHKLYYYSIEIEFVKGLPGKFLPSKDWEVWKIIL